MVGLRGCWWGGRKRSVERDAAFDVAGEKREIWGCVLKRGIQMVIIQNGIKILCLSYILV